MRYPYGKRAASLLILLAMLLTMASPVFAAATVRLELSADRIAIGKTLTIEVKVGSGVPDLSSVGFDMTFDANAFSFVSGSVNGTAKGDNKASFTLQGTDVIQLTAADYLFDTDSDPLLATLQFKAKAASAGSAFTLENIVLGDYTESVNPVPATFAGAQSVIFFQPSTNADLSQLVIEPGTLEPAFTPANTVYSVQVPEGVNALTIDALPADDKAKVSVSGHTGLQDGENTVKVVVTAESGATKTYTIKAIKATPSPTPEATPTPAATVTIDGAVFTVQSIGDDQTPPPGFAATTTMLSGQPVPAYVDSRLNLLLLYLADSAGNQDFFLLDTRTEKLSLYRTLTIPAITYTVLDADPTQNAPEGFVPAEVMVGGHFAKGFSEATAGSDGQKQTLVYLQDATGRRDLYTFDATSGQVTLFSGLQETPVATVTPVPTVSATPTQAATITPGLSIDPDADGDSGLDRYLLIILILGFIVLVLAGILTYLLMARKAYHRNQETPVIRRIR